MKFGLFFEIQVPKPWDPDSEVRAFHEAIEQAVLADRLGYDVIWAAEHHFLEEYSHDPAPEIFLAAVAARTNQIRIGHGIKHLTTNHPWRIAEQVATLDIISRGRVEFGMGEGSNTTELHPFDVRFREKREVFEDAVRALMPAFWNTSWAYTGTHFNLPERNLIPKPIQKPHPPLWVACSQAETIRMAGRWGMGALGFAFVDPDAARAWVHAYYNAFLNAPLPLESYVRNPNLACSYYFSCGPTDEIAIERADGATFFEFSLGKYQKDGPFAAGQTSFWTDYEEWRATDKAKQKQANLARTMVIGSPATLRERIKEIRDTHIDQIVLIAQTGRTPHQDIMDSIELFGTEVMPEFQGDSEHEAWKQKVLDRENVLDDIDTTGQNTLLAVDQAVRPETKAFAQNL